MPIQNFGTGEFMPEGNEVENLIFLGKLKKPNLHFKRFDGIIIILRHTMPCMFEDGYKEGRIYTIKYSPRCSIHGDVLPGKVLSSAEIVRVAVIAN